MQWCRGPTSQSACVSWMLWMKSMLLMLLSISHCVSVWRHRPLYSISDAISSLTIRHQFTWRETAALFAGLLLPQTRYHLQNLVKKFPPVWGKWQKTLGGIFLTHTVYIAYIITTTTTINRRRHHRRHVPLNCLSVRPSVTLWYYIKTNMATCDTLPRFWRELKTFLFRQSCPSILI